MNRSDIARSLITTLLLATLTAGCGEIGTPVSEFDAGSESDVGRVDTGQSDAGGVDSGQPDSGGEGQLDVGTDASTPCVPSEEVCDGADNDCDGETDEGFAVGDACQLGIGACAVEGSTICNQAGDDVICDATEEEPAVELCGDQIDNDCDGEIDEGFDTVGSSCTVGVGVCEANGTIVCSSDGIEAVCDVGPGQPGEIDERTCDQLDNDCDGQTDEGCDDDGDGYCEQGFVDGSSVVCPNGGGDCDDTNQDIYPNSPIPGCDGADNDCDGTADERSIVPNTSRTATLGINMDDTDSVNAPGFLVAPMGQDRYCGFGSFQNGTGVQFFFIDYSGSSPSVQLAGSLIRFDLRIIDIVAETSSCTGLFGYDDGGTPRLAIARAQVGQSSVEFTNVSTDSAVITAPWAGALYARFAGNYNVFGLTNTGSPTGRVYRRNFTISNSSYDAGPVLLQHVVMAQDTSGSGKDDLIIANTFGGTQAWTSDTQSTDRMSDWEVPHAMFFPDVSGLGMRTFHTGYDGTTFYVLELSAMPPTHQILASGNRTTSSDRSYMTRHQLFAGPNNEFFVIDAAADDLLEMTVFGGSITFETADLGSFSQNRELVAGKALTGDRIEILGLSRGGGQGGNPVNFEAVEVSCF